MPMYEVEQYVVCVDTYLVKAASPKEAKAKVLAGEGEMIQPSEYVRAAEEVGHKSFGRVRRRECRIIRPRNKPPSTTRPAPGVQPRPSGPWREGIQRGPK